MYQLPLSPPLSLKRKYLFLSLREEEKTFLNGSKGYSKGTMLSSVNYFFFFFKILFILERWEGREKEREKHQCARDTLIGCLWHAPNWGYGQRPRYVL